MKNDWLIILLLLTILAMSVNNAYNEVRINKIGQLESLEELLIITSVLDSRLELLEELVLVTSEIANKTIDYVHNMKKVQARMQIWWHNFFDDIYEEKIKEENIYQKKRIST